MKTERLSSEMSDITLMEELLLTNKSPMGADHTLSRDPFRTYNPRGLVRLICYPVTFCAGHCVLEGFWCTVYLAERYVYVYVGRQCCAFRRRVVYDLGVRSGDAYRTNDVCSDVVDICF